MVRRPWKPEIDIDPIDSRRSLSLTLFLYLSVSKVLVVGHMV